MLPASATAYVQAVQSLTGHVCGFDMQVANQHRWTPAFASGAPHGMQSSPYTW